MMQITGWAIVHSIWQGALIACALGVFLWATRYASAQMRYVGSLIALVLCVALPIITATRTAARPRLTSNTIAVQDATIGNQQTDNITPSVTSDLSAQRVADATPSAPSQTTPAFVTSAIDDGRRMIQPQLHWLVLAWLIGLLALSVRLIGGLVRTRRLANDGVSAENAQLRVVVERIASLLAVRQTFRVVESARISVPLVIGAVRPIIVVPASLITGLAPWQLEMLLAHELAHIRRYDYLVNLMQTVIETLLFYHPAVRWISARVREERENCCDDLAVKVCGGDRAGYSTALLALEESRDDNVLFAAAATGNGSLVKRISRLLGAHPDHVSGSRWVAGVITIAAALFAGRQAVGMSAQTVPALSMVTRASFFAPPVDTTEDYYADQGRGAPQSVVRITEGTFAERVRAAASRAPARRYWIGYLVAGDPSGRDLMHFDRYVAIRGEGITLNGHTRFGGSTGNFHFPGVPLAPLVGRHSAISTAIFVLVEGRSSPPRPIRMHLGSFTFPVHFDRLPLVWIDSASDAESIALLRSMDSRSLPTELREDLVAAIGAHNTSSIVVPILAQTLTSGPKDVRQESAEWLGRHPTPEAMSALSRALRTDPNYDIREEAVEAFEEMRTSSAVDSLMVFARSLPDYKLRGEAVEALAQHDEPRVVQFLTAVARGNDEYHVRDEALEALGEMHDSRAFAALIEIARNGRESAIRAKAVETIGEFEKSAEALRVLREFAGEANDPEVRKAAIEAIAEQNTAGAADILKSIVASGRDEYTQIEAVEALAESHSEADVVSALSRAAREHPSDAVRRKAIESLGERDEPSARAALESIARSNMREDLRREAIEAYGESASSKETIGFLRSLLDDPSESIRWTALEALSEMDDAGYRALAEIERTSKDPRIRAKARELLEDR